MFQPKNGSAELSPDVSLLSNLLYESPYESQFWMLFDSNKQLLCSGDSFPSQVIYAGAICFFSVIVLSRVIQVTGNLSHFNPPKQFLSY